MDNYRKKFSEWAAVQKEVEKRSIPTSWKVGGIFWINQGVNIGSEQYGKGTFYASSANYFAIQRETSVSSSC